MDGTDGREPGASGQERGLELQELSNSIARIYKELFGRGPTKVRTDYAGSK